jgi:hypothetical protein
VIEQAAARLLLACAIWDLSVPRSERVRRAAEGVDWNEWLALAQLHRLVPVVKRQLDAAGIAAPADVRTALDAEAREISAIALRRASQLAELQRGFSAARIPVLVYKGPAVAMTAYGELGARRSVDLDVVVHPPDLSRARKELIRAGYTSRYGMSAAQERTIQRSFGHFVFTRGADEGPVELHWRFARAVYPWTLSVDDVFARAARVNIAGEPMLISGPADNVLLQCAHGARHEWETLEWLVALEATLHRTPVDGTALLALASGHRSRRALLLAMLLLRDLLQSDVAPAELLALAEADTVVLRLGAATVARFTQELLPGVHSGKRFALQLMDGPADRANYLLRSAIEPTLREWEFIRLPDALLPLYYVIRPLRWLVSGRR